MDSAARLLISIVQNDHFYRSCFFGAKHITYVEAAFLSSSMFTRDSPQPGKAKMAKEEPSNPNNITEQNNVAEQIQCPKKADTGRQTDNTTSNCQQSLYKADSVAYDGQMLELKLS